MGVPDECVQAYDDMRQYKKYGYVLYNMDQKLTQFKVLMVGPASMYDITVILQSSEQL